MSDDAHGQTSRDGVIIIGSGPAGLGAAIALKKRGVARVIVLERDIEPGGIPRQCGHPPYGIREFSRLMTGPTYARRLRERAIAAGVDIRTRSSVVRLDEDGALTVATSQGQVNLSARRVILATGARETPRSMRMVSGTRPLGVMNTATLQDCIYLKGLKPFLRPVVVGTELVALSALWTCISHGIRPAAVIESGSRTTARWPLGLFPRLFGIPVHYNAEINFIEGAESVDAIWISTGTTRTQIFCDGIVFSGNFIPEASLARTSPLALDPLTGGPLVDQFGRCSDPSYFAAGNLLRPIETAGWCHREGIRTGNAVADDLAGRLPSPDNSVMLKAGDGIRWILPQRIAIAANAKPHGIHLRVSEAARGYLTMRQDGALIWSQSVRTLPERRLHISAAAVRCIQAGVDVVIAIEPKR